MNPRHPYTAGLLNAVPHLEPGRGVAPPAVVGDPPSPIHLPSGCRYHPRCPLVEEVCRREDPLLEVGPWHPGHASACHFADRVEQLALRTADRRGIQCALSRPAPGLFRFVALIFHSDPGNP